MLKAVDLIGIRKQKCFVHGLDIVVRNIVFSCHDPVLDIAILEDAVSCAEGHFDDREEDESEADFDSDQEDVVVVILGESLSRLRKIARDFRKKPVLMDEIRRVTAQNEFDGKSLKVKLDCRTG